ncbi:MAG: 30S ribosome-binding factor RbfA [Pseudomonadota bacterium]
MARRPKQNDRQANGPSQRQLRVGELIRHTISDLLTRGDIHDDTLGRAVVTIPEVRCSPDLRNATVYVMPLGGQDIDAVLAALRRNTKFIRGAVARKVNLKYAPDLSFQTDQTFAEADKIGRVLNSPKVRQDLENG